MRTDISIGLFDLLIFLGFFQTLLVAIFFIRNRSKQPSNVYQGLFQLSLALVILAYLLDSTGYIVKVLAISNFNSPISFVLGPLFYLSVKHTIYPESNHRKAWVHFVFALVWLCYMITYFIQPDECKYNSYVSAMHPDWPYVHVDFRTPNDPLHIGANINIAAMLHLFIYITLSGILLLKRLKSMSQSFFMITNEQLAQVRNDLVHITLIVLIYTISKTTLGLSTETGGYMFSYCTILITITTFRIINDSSYFDRQHSIIELPFPKYQKSSLSDEKKELILGKIKREMEANLYFTNNLASLSGLAKQINESHHHVSQVINEKLNKSFFEVLAAYRIEHATKLLKEQEGNKLTVEELAERVGYNSKSSFNTAFKKHTQLTPSEYRRQL